MTCFFKALLKFKSDEVKTDLGFEVEVHVVEKPPTTQAPARMRKWLVVWRKTLWNYLGKYHLVLISSIFHHYTVAQFWDTCSRYEKRRPYNLHKQCHGHWSRSGHQLIVLVMHWYEKYSKRLNILFVQVALLGLWQSVVLVLSWSADSLVGGCYTQVLAQQGKNRFLKKQIQ